MKRILILSFYYSPDLCAGSFRAQALINSLMALTKTTDIHIDVVTTLPNRYSNFQVEAPTYETNENITIHRIKIPSHHSGFLDQAKAFSYYFFTALKITHDEKYDIVYATSSRLFTAFLGACIASKKRKPLFLDIRDIFTDTMESILKFPLKTLVPVFKLVEHYTIKKAHTLNLVSPGFLPYFKVNKRCKTLTISNGIDSCFYGIDYKNTRIECAKKRILYAGNIGQGQRLEKIVPVLAKAFESECEFYIIGNGGAVKALKTQCEKLPNVFILSPVNRETLITHYQDADILFLHLDNLPAFNKVLPSKIFEYAVTEKPILAGVAGYSADFLKAEVSNSWIFPPCDTTRAIAELKSLLQCTKANTNRTDFCNKFNREKLMDALAHKIIEYV
jgi:hypothetical protein